ncbi:16S rRNA (guanine(527)-N(7))-methyltransferase RsmG [Lactobacillus amylovorus]|jgi:16S rRNA (guanine527-N7)-methyltransferase|uniref:Ribosomal RNA small subunit methyltransferase G n=4 Tax=Lactobacillus amylovorus TaxID=1604 RepID=F0TH98_LACAM|nr:MULTISPECIES: 16S rRNA (guanine(527)-N(7))-methyltransferase RsmG [Lactobacillus]NLD06579.1 16S rRNA (guanine(527)-N(7))-methyltransferase RsmG [Lactobacillus sp.]CDA27491.1 ribosomal RNA small subunit methyltransferase G [Lactobacillus amylovorus CAG:719]ADQ59921.1 16S rRNA methyltransferase GidB [Lactobacillus amylovorus GRL 1112]ADZ08092.1 16S rRNA methyltransferase GidB [Lactobacillus amylovorus]AEA32711.1 16S rRNA methyltransferase GidB [Lactobacillus amylovorus GRL1118]
MNPEKFVLELSKHNFELTDKQKQQFKLYFKMLIEVNEHVNLTRITEEDEVYLKHFYDSITPLFTFGAVFKDGATLCDVGAGAGFPSIPLKILKPGLKVTIVDSLQKRLNFLKDLISELGLTDVELVHGRAEDVGQNKLYRERFDIVTARAVARMSVLSEYCLPLVKKGGYFVALKGPKAEDELDDGKKALEVLGGKLIKDEELTLPASEEERTLVLVQKVKSTPKKYPRQAGTPRRKPIH